MFETAPTHPRSLTLRVLDEDQCAELYQAALECLERVGVLIHHPAARQLLIAAGARAEEARVYIPAVIIRQAVAAAPQRFTVYGRDEKYVMNVERGQVHFGPGPTCTYFYDPCSGERRKARRGDAGLTARVCEALPNLDYVMSLSLYDDVTPLLSPVYEFADMLAYTGKPLVAWATNTRSLADIYQIAAAAAGGEEALRRRPNFILFATYESPLRHSSESLGNLLWAAEHGIPVVDLGGPTVGLESPVTGASALVLYLAAALSALTVVQLKCPGAPMAIGGVPSAMDLRTARPAYGSPEMSLHSAAAADLAHSLGLPFMGTAAASEAKRVDAQAAMEAALQVLMALLSQAELVHDVGFLDCADIGSLELLVLADEIIALARRLGRGVPVSKDTILLDLIARVGPGGHFLTEPESVALCRREIWVPRLSDRNAYAIWEEKGAASMEQRLKAQLDRILAQPPARPLSLAVQQEIAAILERAEQRERAAA